MRMSEGCPHVIPLPDDVDASDMPFMPLYIDRLMRSRSWRRAKYWTGGGPGLGFALMNMWLFAVRERPAGSIEADEDDAALMEAAQVSAHDWPAMRAAVMAGWVLIDGRWYHAVVMEMAWNFWCERLKARHEKAFARWKSAAKRARDDGREPPEPIGAYDEWVRRTYPASAARLFPCVPVTNGPRTGDELGLSPERSGDDAGTDGRSNGGITGTGGGCDGDVTGTTAESLTRVAVKGREGKGVAPLDPPHRDNGTRGLGRGNGGYTDGAERRKEAGKQWFAAERARLYEAFGEHAQLLQSQCGGPVKFVEIFRDLDFSPGDVARLPVISAPTPARLRQAKTIISLSGIEAACFRDGVQFTVVRKARRGAAA
jgi:hypothetical protein